ncbi:MAG: ribosome recycling factor [Patescibacteria group bacterium]
MNFNQKTTSLIQTLKEELAPIRANRPTPALLEDVQAEYYGQMMPLKQMGAIHIKPPREIQIQAWDKEGVTAIVKAIQESSLGLTPMPDGNTIRVFLPELSAERREELSRHVKKITEGYRIQLRAAREEANKEIERMEKAGELTEDDKFRRKEDIQKQTDTTNEEMEAILQRKVKEINV